MYRIALHALRNCNFSIYKVSEEIRLIISLQKTCGSIGTLLWPFRSNKNISLWIVILFQIATTSSRRATSCMRFSRTHSQTVHSATSSAITKSESGSRLNHRTVNNTTMSEDGIDTAMQIDNQNEVSIQND